MKPARLAWTIWAVNLALAIAGLTVGAIALSDLIPGDLRSSVIDLIPGMTALLTPTLGALILARQPRHAIGWVFAAAGTASNIGFLARNYSRVALYVFPELNGAVIAGWFADLFDATTFAILGPLFLLLFPTGTPLSRRWRPVIWMAIAGVGLMLLATMFAPGELENLPAQNPFAVNAVAPLVGVADNLVAVCLLAGIVSLVLRFRRSTGVARQQLKWLVFVVLVGAASVPLWIVLVSDDAAGLAIGTTLFAGIPLGAGLAVLRYRLYDIDRIISRTVTYIVVTGVLVAAYLGLVVVFQRALAPVTGTSDVAVAASTLVTAVLFGPVRTRVQRTIDRRFNRSRYDAERTIAGFTARLRDEIDIDALGTELRDVVRQAVHPSDVWLWTVRSSR